ncbi:PAS domain-containing sensor histidine kinase [Litchfieldia salsa]|uniref:histidine kinase n=1 Tax=Litchfieldia salsa TaxID=930152 RepID=A0A1H0S0V4_9BACI|nr:PAS domain-containing sensor histidine kinase [Litchfieldia salsa]SDP35267.1 two-component system, sporulation sensor kinase A [Litchfieldia salsa]
MLSHKVLVSALDECRDYVMIMKVEQIGIYTYDYANRFALEAGTIQESDYGKMLEDVISSDRAAYLKRKYEECILSKKKTLVDHTCFLKNGKRLCNGYVTPVFSENGACTHLIMITKIVEETKLRDKELYNATISERRKMIKKLEHSNEKYELITRNMSDIIIIVNNEGKIKYISPSCQNILQYTVDELIDEICFNYVHKNDLEEVIYRFENVETKKNHDPFEFRIKHSNQQYIWFEIKTTTVLNSLGELDHLVLVARDITNRKLAESELKKSREKYNLVSRHTTDLIKMYGLNGVIYFASPSHEEMLGYSASELEGKNMFEYIHPSDRLTTKEQLEESIKKKVPILIEKRLRSAKNEWVFVESIITPIVDEDGTIETFVGVSRNMTDRIKNDELIRNLDRLSIIGQLAAGVAHEIRNPLTALKGFSKLMQSTLMDTDQLRYIKIIIDELDRIELIVNEFMSLAKPQAVEFEEANIQDLIKGTLTVFETQALLHNVTIETIITHQEPLIIFSQPNQIKQVFMNFIKNAIEAMSFGGNIIVSLRVMKNDTVEVCFSDNGVGIPQERLKHLGTPFYTTKEKGIGLGLTISNKIIKEHGGEMIIESIPNHGTTVKVTLPLLIKSVCI